MESKKVNRAIALALLVLIISIVFAVKCEAKELSRKKVYWIVLEDRQSFRTYTHHTYSLDTVVAYYTRAMEQPLNAVTLFRSKKHYFETRNEKYWFYVEEKWAIKKSNGKTKYRRIKNKRK